MSWLEQIDAAVIEPRIDSADLVLGCSNFIAEGVRRRFFSLAGRCHYVYNGSDIAFFARAKSLLYELNTGGLVEAEELVVPLLPA